jgi:hypothetical protein
MPGQPFERTPLAMAKFLVAVACLCSATGCTQTPHEASVEADARAAVQSGPIAASESADDFFDGKPHGPYRVDEALLQAADAAIGPEPATPAEAERMLTAIYVHPLYVEVQRRTAAYDVVSKFERNPDGSAVRSPRNWSEAKYRNADGVWQPERAAEQQAAVARLLNPAAVAPPGTTPKAFVLLGSPAAGKTSVGAPRAKALGCEFTTVNDDDVAPLLRGYEGWNATMLHVESSYVVKELLTRKAIELHHNLLLDTTGADSHSTRQRIDRLVEAGYEIHICHVATPPEKCAWRAWNRFRANAFGPPDEDRGRFVDPKFVYYGMGHKADATYEALKNLPNVVSWVRLMPAGIGQPPKILDQGERKPSSESRDAAAP